MGIESLDVIVVGGGVVGLSCALEIAGVGLSVALIERHNRLGQETSTHNSGVIHAGIYYEAGSLKAKLCLRGSELLVPRLVRWKVPHRICGKLIVAMTEAEIPVLEKLECKGRTNGVDSLKMIDADIVRKIEPNVPAVTALHSPETGVFDVGEYLRLLELHAEQAGAIIIKGAKVIDVDRDGRELVVTTDRGERVATKFLINAAGLWADEVAGLCGETNHRIFPCRGEYASVIQKRQELINGLVYPVPAKLSLGVHLTRTIDGELWIGPTARYIKSKENYESGRMLPDAFWPEAQRLCPKLKKTDLRMGQSGIRPKRYGPDDASNDFHIASQADDGRIIHLIGIESPGLTASAAIGEMIANKAKSFFG